MKKMTIAQRIKTTREARGFTASDLARLTDVTPTAVWNWETNDRKPRPETLERIARALAVTVDFLLTGEEAPNEAGAAIRSVPTIVSEAEIEIANTIGVPPGRVKVRFEVLPG